METWPFVDKDDDEFRIGSVESRCGRLSFSLDIDGDGSAHVSIYGYDPTDRRMKGVLVMLDGKEYQKLKSLIQKGDDVITKAKASGQMKRMARRDER